VFLARVTSSNFFADVGSDVIRELWTPFRLKRIPRIRPHFFFFFFSLQTSTNTLLAHGQRENIFHLSVGTCFPVIRFPMNIFLIRCAKSTFADKLISCPTYIETFTLARRKTRSRVVRQKRELNSVLGYLLASISASRNMGEGTFVRSLRALN